MTTTRCLTGSEPPVTAIDPEGDLLLYVGKGAHQKIFKVDTCALRRVSPIWNDMLFGGDRKESMSANGERVLRLPSDQPEPMKMVMDIIHTNFTAIPKRLDLEPLYDLLTTTRKYEMIQILRPFAPTWMDAVPQSTWSGDWESAQQLIFTTCIAYELGDEDRVQAQFEILCMKTGIDEDNNSLMLGDICIGDDESLSPQDFFESIAEGRLVIIDWLLAFIHSEIEARRGSDSTGCLLLGYFDNTYCDNVALAGIYEGLKRELGGEPSSAADILQSADDLASQLLRAFELLEIPQGHEVCSVRKRFEELMDTLEIERRSFLPLKPKHRAYMRAQREKTGLAGPSEER